MEILLIGYIAMATILLGFVEIFRSGRSYLALYSSVFALRIVIAILMFVFYGYINAGGDAGRYITVTDSINNGVVSSIHDIIAIYNDDSRYIFYIAISAALNLLFGAAGVILFQSCIHVLSGFFIHLSLIKLGASAKKSAFILFIYLFYPYLIFYSAVYLRDIYLTLATTWFVYALINKKSYLGKFYNLIIPLLIVIGVRVQYLPFYLLFYIAYYFFDKKNGIRWYQWGLIVFGLVILSYWSDFLNMSKLIPYLIANGEIEDDPSVAYNDYNALNYLSITKVITTIIGVFGPYHMFRGADFIFVEYRGDYVERFFEGLSTLLNISMLLSIFLYTVSNYFNKAHVNVLSTEVENLKSQLRKAALVFFMAMIVLLSFVGYNRWKMPLIPILFLYFGVCKIKLNNFLLILFSIIMLLILIIAVTFIFIY